MSTPPENEKKSRFGGLFGTKKHDQRPKPLPVDSAYASSETPSGEREMRERPSGHNESRVSDMSKMSNSQKLDAVEHDDKLSVKPNTGEVVDNDTGEVITTVTTTTTTTTTVVKPSGGREPHKMEHVKEEVRRHEPTSSRTLQEPNTSTLQHEPSVSTTGYDQNSNRSYDPNTNRDYDSNSNRSHDPNSSRNYEPNENRGYNQDNNNRNLQSPTISSGAYEPSRSNTVHEPSASIPTAAARNRDSGVISELPNGTTPPERSLEPPMTYNGFPQRGTDSPPIPSRSPMRKSMEVSPGATGQAATEQSNTTPPTSPSARTGGGQNFSYPNRSTPAPGASGITGGTHANTGLSSHPPDSNANTGNNTGTRQQTGPQREAEGPISPIDNSHTKTGMRGFHSPDDFSRSNVGMGGTNDNSRTNAGTGGFNNSNDFSRMNTGMGGPNDNTRTSAGTGVFNNSNDFSRTNTGMSGPNDNTRTNAGTGGFNNSNDFSRTNTGMSGPNEYSRNNPGMGDSRGPTGNVARDGTVRQNTSTLANLKAAAMGIHGAGETLRGTLNSTIDRRFPVGHDPNKSAAVNARNEAVLARGREELEQGRVAAEQNRQARLERERERSERGYNSADDRRKKGGLSGLLSRKPVAQTQSQGTGSADTPGDQQPRRHF